MTLLAKISIFIILLMAAFGCKKSGTDSTSTKDLKGTVWAGEFQYTTGSFVESQPFSIVINDDGTLTWHDQQNSRPGGKWKTEGDKIILTFPNNTSLSAKISNNTWTEFATATDIGFKVMNLSRSSRPEPASLDNTTWAGQVKRSDGVSDKVTMTFLPGNKTQILLQTKTYSQVYTIAGGGLRIDLPTANYFTFDSELTGLKGYHSAAGVTHYSWELKNNK